MAEEKIRLNSTNQMRGGRKASHSLIAPIDKYLKLYEESVLRGLPVKLISSTEQMVDQAKGKMQREGEDLKLIAQAMKSQSKANRQSGKTSTEKEQTKKKTK